MARPKDPGPEGTTINIQAGQWVSQIAREYGYTHWKLKVWQHDQNQELKRKRVNPYVLAPDDQLFIRGWTVSERRKYTNKKYTFKVKAKTQDVLRIRLLGTKGQPMQKAKYTLTIDQCVGPNAELDKNKFNSNSKTKQADKQGMIEVNIPRSASEMTLLLNESGRRIKLKVGHLLPLTKPDVGDQPAKAIYIQAIRRRLRAMGFQPGDPNNGVPDEALRAALLRFQQWHNDQASGNARLNVTGEHDDSTVKALAKDYGA